MSRIRRCSILLSCFGMLLSVLIAPSANAVSSAPACSVTTSTKGVFGSSEIQISANCPSNDADGGAAAQFRTLICGHKGGKGDAPLVQACGGNGPGEVAACARSVNGTPGIATPFASAPITGNTLGKAQRWCPGDVVPAVAAAAIRAEAIRLLPHVRIGSAWTTTALVNAEVVLWANTHTNRTLPEATVLGTGVRLRIGQPNFHWDFGDDTTDNPTTPGKAYDETGDPCRTAQCADYYGHTYTDTGRMTITLTITWHADFSIAGAAWTNLDDPVTGPTDRHDITLKQARAILVPDPQN